MSSLLLWFTGEQDRYLVQFYKRSISLNKQLSKIPTFMASLGCFNRWKSHHRIGQLAESGESLLGDIGILRTNLRNVFNYKLFK